jgi:precorrin-2 dehydrogenase/sirohydrochlorin ferrochelatase
VRYYPAFLSLKNKKAVVVGGGKVAERKVRLLVKAGANVKIISPVITKPLEKLRDEGNLKHVNRNYIKRDLKNAYIVIAATSSVELNTKIAGDSENLVNVVDTPSEGNYIVPSVVTRGPLTIAISTEGTSPAVSKTIRKEVEKHYSKEFTNYMRFLEVMREKAVAEITDSNKRRKFLKSLASEKLICIVRNQGFGAASAIISNRFNRVTNKKSY